MSIKRLPRKSESPRKSIAKRKTSGKKKSPIEDSVMVYVSEATGEGIPKLSAKFLPKETYFCLSKEDKKPFQLITVTPAGTNIGWTSCGNCNMYFTQCECKLFTVPRSVEVACDHDQADIDGEEWTHLHPNYRGSIREKIKRSQHRGDALTKSLASIVSEPKTTEIKTEYDKKRLDKKVKGQSKRSLSEFKRLVDAPEGSQKKRLKGATSGTGTRKRSLKRKS